MAAPVVELLKLIVILSHALIVEEAGGIVTTVEGEELPCLEKSSILARNK